MEQHGDIPIHLAATVIVLREHAGALEALLVQRASALAFHGGAWVFPGGRVDPADAVTDDARETARRAAVREAAEEAGIVLAPDALVTTSHWTTPPGRTRRFATWFFAVELESAIDVVVDGGEICAHRWLRPSQALALHTSNELELPPPTFVALSELADFERAARALAFYREREPIIYVPRQQPVASGVLSLYHGDVAYEGGDPDREGPRHRLSMLQGGWRYQRT